MPGIMELRIHTAGLSRKMSLEEAEATGLNLRPSTECIARIAEIEHSLIEHSLHDSLWRARFIRVN